MITIRKWAEAYCIECGMPETEAQEVVKLAEQAPGFEPMQGHWDKDSSLMPDEMRALLLLAVVDNAVDYIAVHLPDAPYKDRFVRRRTPA